MTAPIPQGAADALHLLNRAGFGPRPGSIRSVLGKGIQTYLDEQLHPVADPSLAAELARFKVLSYSVKNILDVYHGRVLFGRGMPDVVEQFSKQGRRSMDAELLNVIVAYIKPFKLDAVAAAVRQIPNSPGMSASEVGGFGSHLAHPPRPGERSEVHPFEATTRIEIFCTSAMLVAIIEGIRKAAYTGQPGDGKIFAAQVNAACRIRTGELGQAALLPAKPGGAGA